MNERLRWWVLPGAMIVLLRVVTLDQPETPAASRTAVDASGEIGTVAVLDAAGKRTQPGLVPLATTEAFVVTLPSQFVGQRGDMTLWRRVGDHHEAAPWLQLRPRVRTDATIPIAGLAAGRYDVELCFDGMVLRAENVVAPGTIVLAPVEPQPPR